MKKLLLLILILQLNSCMIQGSEIKPVVPSTSGSGIYQSQSPNPISSTVFENNLFCEPRNESDHKIVLKYPYDLAVSNDGSTVYITREKCLQTKYDYTLRKTFCVRKDSNNNECLAEEFSRINPIYKITSDKKVDTLKINEKIPDIFDLGDELEIDPQDNLYINDLINHRIYKISEKYNLISQIAEIKIRSRGPYYRSKDYLPEDLSGPTNLYFNLNNIYFYMYNPYEPPGEYYVKKLSSDSIISDIFYKEEAYVDREIISVFNEKIYLELTENSGKRIITDEEIIKNKLGAFKSIRFNSKGEMFITKVNSHVIWKIIPFQGVSKFAGNGKAGFKDGKGEEAEFSSPTAISFDAMDNLYILDLRNMAVRKITTVGVVSTFYSQNE